VTPDRAIVAFIALVAAACSLLIGGCGSSFPHDTTRVRWMDRHGGASERPVSLVPGTDSATLISDVIGSTLGCRELIVSWNADVPDGLGIAVEARVRTDQDAGWSPWLFIGEAGHVPFPSPVTSGGTARVDVDILESTSWFKQAQVRITAFAGPEASAGESVVLHRLDVTRTLALGRGMQGLRRDLTGPPPDWNSLGLPSRVDLGAPFVSQKTPRPELSGRLCSPASVAMAVTWAGREDATVEAIANAAHDARHDLYGNWPRNVQAAWQYGVPGKVARIGSLEDAWRTLASGILIVASIKADQGQLKGAPYADTQGHLIVIRGYDAEGHFLVSDPACSTPEAGQRVYSRRDMAQVWLLNKRGTCYLFAKPNEAFLLDSGRGAPR
jgi:hypothetical protein